jgi:predicted phage terminase large subunit-like protein
VHTRWHPDDLIGRLEADGWEVVNLPAITAEDESLWPSQRPREFLRQREREVGPYEWAALYMGQPRARGGAVFSATPTTYSTPPGELTRGIGLDLAYSAKTSADWSVAVVMGKAGQGQDARYYVLDVLRAQMRASDFAQQLAMLRARWPHTASRIYAGGADRGALDFLALPPPRGVGLQVEVKTAIGDKYARATPLAAAWNAGRVLVREGAAWLPDLCDEVARFTGQGDAHDDQVDALAAAFDLLAEMHVGSGVASTGRRVSADLTTDYAPRVGRKNYWG